MGWGGSLGSQGWGATPWGGGGSQLQLLKAEAVRENVVRLTFNNPVRFTRVLDPNDAADPSRYSVSTIEGTKGLDGLPVRPVRVCTVELVEIEGAGGRLIDVGVDRPFSPFPAVYRIAVSQLVTLSGQVLDTEFASFTFLGLYRGIPPKTAELAVSRRDIANPNDLEALLDPLPDTSDATQLGVYPVDETGDYAADEGKTSYKKRVYRRVTTRKNSYVHLQGYGVGLLGEVKQLAKTSTQQRLAADAEDQIRQEPETDRVSVTFIPDARAPGVFIMQVRARSKAGESVNFDLPFFGG